MSLSKEEEAKAFSEITAGLSLDEKFTHRVVNTDRKFSSQRSMMLTIISVSVGIVVLLAGLYVANGITETIVGASGFIIMVIGAFVFFPAKGEVRSASSPKSAYMLNLEKQWEERKQREGRA